MQQSSGIIEENSINQHSKGLSYKSKVQSVYFKDKAKLPSHHDEKLFIGKVPKIEMKNMVGSMENFQKSFKTSLYLIMNWKRKRKQIISKKSTLENNGIFKGEGMIQTLKIIKIIYFILWY